MTDNARVSPDCHGKNKPMPSLNTMETLFRTVIGLKQREGLLRAGYCVAEALIKILGKAAIGAIVGEFLDIAQSAADFIPVPGLKAAAGALISVWEAVKLVTVNQAACFRLTERCATILISVHEEVVKAGSEAFVGLQDVLDRLIQSYHNVHVLFGEYAQFSFLKRYILRKDIERDLLEHQLRLNDILKVFTASVVVRIYHLCKRNTELVERFVRESPGETGFAKMKLAPPSPTSVSSPVDSTPGITGIAGLREYLLSQDDADHEADLGVLRSRVQEAAEARDDHKIIELIGVDRTWWTPAIRSLTQLDTVPEVEDEELPTATKTPIISSGVHAGAQRPFTRSARAKQLDAQVTRLHADFVRNSEGALRRLSGTENNSDSTVLPRSWTITNLEVLRQESIGTGAAAEVFKGVWKGYLVAIKQLADTPTLTKAVFEHEAKMWMNLKHSNVLRLFGATSTDDPMPWFFVCPYYKNGNLITFLREPRRKLEFINILKMVIEIARGMEYLHSKSIVHGDLKGANVLVGEDERCIISDFGVSQFRTCAKGDHREQCNFGSPPQWKAPELFDDNYVPSYQTDVYAFAITCIEVIQKGELPWPIGMDDERVRQSVLEGSRPTLPSTFQHRVWWGPFRELVGSCWSHSPSERPLFTPIVRNLDDFQLGYILGVTTLHFTDPGVTLSCAFASLETLLSEPFKWSTRLRF
ncbi:kinase-like domain-containing protein [Daedaleopsis nitida]|nr:kinase-like domain-containing protein [Daedaleopsis nitida]